MNANTFVNNIGNDMPGGFVSGNDSILSNNNSYQQADIKSSNLGYNYKDTSTNNNTNTKNYDDKNNDMGFQNNTNSVVNKQCATNDSYHHEQIHLSFQNNQNGNNPFQYKNATFEQQNYNMNSQNDSSVTACEKEITHNNNVTTNKQIINSMILNNYDCAKNISAYKTMNTNSNDQNSSPVQWLNTYCDNKIQDSDDNIGLVESDQPVSNSQMEKTLLSNKGIQRPEKIKFADISLMDDLRETCTCKKTRANVPSSTHKPNVSNKNCRCYYQVDSTINNINNQLDGTRERPSSENNKKVSHI